MKVQEITEKCPKCGLVMATGPATTHHYNVHGIMRACAVIASKHSLYKTFSLEADGDFVMCVGRDENSIDALMHEASRLAGLGHVVTVSPCL